MESQPSEDLEAEFEAFRIDKSERRSTHSSRGADGNEEEEEDEDDDNDEEEEEEEEEEDTDGDDSVISNQLFLHCRRGQYKSIHLEVVDRATDKENTALARDWVEALSYLLHRQKSRRLSFKR